VIIVIFIADDFQQGDMAIKLTMSHPSSGDESSHPKIIKSYVTSTSWKIT